MSLDELVFHVFGHEPSALEICHRRRPEVNDAASTASALLATADDKALRLLHGGAKAILRKDPLHRGAVDELRRAHRVACPQRLLLIIIIVDILFELHGRLELGAFRSILDVQTLAGLLDRFHEGVRLGFQLDFGYLVASGVVHRSWGWDGGHGDDGFFERGFVWWDCQF